MTNRFEIKKSIPEELRHATYFLVCFSHGRLRQGRVCIKRHGSKQRREGSCIWIHAAITIPTFFGMVQLHGPIARSFPRVDCFRGGSRLFFLPKDHHVRSCVLEMLCMFQLSRMDFFISSGVAYSYHRVSIPPSYAGNYPNGFFSLKN